MSDLEFRIASLEVALESERQSRKLAEHNCAVATAALRLITSYEGKPYAVRYISAAAIKIATEALKEL